MKISTAKSTQTSEMQEYNKELYYLKIENSLGNKTVLNVGKKTYESIQKLNNEEMNNDYEKSKKHEIHNNTKLEDKAKVR